MKVRRCCATVWSDGVRPSAQALLRVLAGWARERGADVLNLHVVATNAPALALYQRLGFRATGATEPLPHTPSVREHHMVCALEQWRSDG
jgi:RimJ/RimL family protein N-acetyltransferase